MQIRYSASLFFPLAFTAASFIYLTEKRRFLVFWFFLFAFLYGTALIDEYSSMAKQGDWIRISEYLKSHEQKNEPILIPDTTYAYPFEIHYSGKNSVITIYDKLSTRENENKLLQEIDNTSGCCWWVFQIRNGIFILKKQKWQRR